MLNYFEQTRRLAIPQQPDTMLCSYAIQDDNGCCRSQYCIDVLSAGVEAYLEVKVAFAPFNVRRDNDLLQRVFADVCSPCGFWSCQHGLPMFKPAFSAFSPGLNMVEPGQSEAASSGDLSEITECGRASKSSDR